MNKVARQHKLIELIGNIAVDTQEQLTRLLKQYGFEATQATLSRDLRELQVVKVRDKNGSLVYALKTEVSDDGKRINDLTRIMHDLVNDIQQSRNMIVLKTAPGNAQSVAVLLDKANITGIMGTVAGDDTILVVVEDADKGSGVIDRLRKIWLYSRS